MQSAVSQQIARLERELGAELFDRSPRRMRLTAAGAAFLPAAREVLTAERRAIATIADRSNLLRIGTSRGMGKRLEQVLEALDRRGTRVELVSAPPGQRLRRVADREWDAAFLRGEVAAPEAVRLIPVWRDELMVAVSARHAPGHADGIEPAQLAELPLYLTARDDNPPLVDLVMAACKTAGFDPLRGPAHSSLQDTLAALGAGAPGWTVLYGTAARELRPGRVAFLPVRTPGGFALPTVLAVHGAAVPYGLATPS